MGQERKPGDSLQAWGVGERALIWCLRGLWFSLPWSAGGVIGDALAATSTAFARTSAAGVWAGWALGLVALLIPSASSLTAIRFLAPAALAACCWAMSAAPSPDSLAVGVEPALGAGRAATILGAASASAICVLSALPLLGRRFIDAMSYGDERRLPLRPPAGVLLLGLPVTWAVTLGGLTAGPLLWAAGGNLAGPLLLGLGLPPAFLGMRSMLALARRWLVFVPAGIVLHDGFAAKAPTLFRRSQIASFGPAPAVRGPDDPPATDLSAGAAGLVLELRLTEGLQMKMRGRDPAQATESLLLAPTQARLALDIAAERRIPLG